MIQFINNHVHPPNLSVVFMLQTLPSRFRKRDPHGTRVPLLINNYPNSFYLNRNIFLRIAIKEISKNNPRGCIRKKRGPRRLLRSSGAPLINHKGLLTSIVRLRAPGAYTGAVTFIANQNGRLELDWAAGLPASGIRASWPYSRPPQ